MAELQNVSGIGEKTAQRIVEMRGKIGFFAKKEHIKSVYGITEENYQRMLPQLEVSDPAPAQKKNLNKITYSELMAYPLMQKTAVSALINSRKLNGYFKTWETVQSVEGLSPEMLEVLKLYFVVQE
jgi:DNA uptake protein ComE-like DNA-binding protein